MRLTLQISFLFFVIFSLNARQHDWENQHVLQINKEPARAAFIGYGKHPGDRTISLDGEWKFHWSPTPKGAISGFYKPDFDDSSWKDLAVPANWEMNGYGTPIYVSSGYSFRIDPPSVTATPKKKYTTYIERDPTGQYRRNFTVPNNWLASGQVFLRFDGVQSAFYVWVNGKKVGYSQVSMDPSEFNITRYMKKGNNQISVQVYKYSDASYLEDQDMWRLGGIFRPIVIYHTPEIRISDIFVRTILDKNYKNATLEVDPTLNVFGNQTGKGYIVRATIDSLVNVTANASDILNLDHKAKLMNEWYPQRGPRKLGRLKAEVKDPLKWTAETPNLYTLIVSLEDSTGKVVERVRQRIGFRSIQIKNGQMLVNGKPIRLRGVNRHEQDPKLGKVMTDSLMLKDILLMKRANINAVRTCHYPDVTRWYQLCDSLGIYVLDEADLEEQGLRGTLASDPDWAFPFLDRAIGLAERDKNHPSVIMWSLGNESGYGMNFAAMSGWLHDFDPGRPVHYEGAQGIDGKPDPSTVDVISRFYPRVCQEYLNPDVPKGSDVERPENARWERLLKIAERTNDDRPVLTSEYCHAMGNALGNLQDYWNEIYSNKRMLGGFIWEWADGGLYKKLPNGKTEIAYGGDFGDYPNLHAFCIKGIVTCDREITSKYKQVKKVYQPIDTKLVDGKLRIINRQFHSDMSAFSVVWTATSDGKTIGKGELNIPNIQPGDTAFVAMPTLPKIKNNKDEYLKISYDLKKDCAWAKAGFEVAYEQFCRHPYPLPAANLTNKGKVHVTETNGNLVVKTRELNAAWNLKNGDLTSLVLDGKEMLDIHSKGFETQPVVQAFRAPTDNDRGFGNWLAKDWRVNHLDHPEVQSEMVSHSVRKDGAVVVSVKITNQYLAGKIATYLNYIIYSNGTMDIKCRFDQLGKLPDLPRLGIAFAINPAYDTFSWFGHGPQESYPDRKSSALMGLWKGNVTDQYENYAHPQDSGNKEDVSVLSLTNKHNQGIKINAVGHTFAASALHYSANDIYSAKHACELVPRKEVILSIDCAVLGLGNSSCGPGVLLKYAINHKEHSMHLRISGNR